MLPRIFVWKQGMIKEFSELDCVRGHTFGKRPILPFKSTCYARRPEVRTPSPICDASVMNFKNELLQRVLGTFSPQSLEDITDLYKKHVAAAPNEVSPVYAQSIIVDIIDYFYQRAQKDKSNDNRRSTNSAEATWDSPVQTPEDNGHHTDDHHDNVVGDRPVEAADVNVQHSDDHDDIVVGDFPDQGADDNGGHFDEQTDNVLLYHVLVVRLNLIKCILVTPLKLQQAPHMSQTNLKCPKVVAKERRGMHVILRPMPLVIMLPPVFIHVGIPFHQMLQCQQLASQIIMNL
ncbi:hypothetical protein PVAP13_5KG753201 [Panicum virgatum]|uniref:Uncharacterized protein n=1 Tax=Panicum virgatum TaxID=38727 RepID=A0A8T0SUC0_PANVG|nr:hypothetical protein PVAP13_5KG753201 [Panicum virgatum]